MIKPTNKTCNQEVQKFTNTSYDMLLELYNNTNFFKDLYESLNPSYYVDFSVGLNGWQATEGTGELTYFNGTTFSNGGDFYNSNLNISAEDNSNISLIFEVDTVNTFVGDLEITYTTGTVLYEGVIELNSGVSTMNLNLDQEPTHTGTITGMRFILGSENTDIFRIYKIVVGKPLVSINNLTNLESRLLNLENAITLINTTLTEQDSRVVELEEKPVILLDSDSLPSDQVRYILEGLSVTGNDKKVTVREDAIDFRNSDDSSYLIYDLPTNVYEYKGRLILTDGSIIEDISDIRALDGEDGDFQEFRFIRSENTPVLDPEEPNPAGFTLFPPTGSLPIWMIIAKKNAEGVLLNDWSTPVKLSGDSATASPTIVAYLTSESYTAVSEFDGTNPNLSGAGGEFVLTSNGNRITTGVNYSGGTTKNGLTLTINPSTGLFNLTGSNWSTDIEFFNLTASYNDTTYTKRFTVIKQKGAEGGNNGTNVITLLLYKSSVRVATSLQGPTGPITFNLSTLTFSNDSLDALNGWSPVLPEDTLPKRWLIQATVSTTSTTVQIQPSQWSVARVLSIDGVDGDDAGGGTGLDGFNTATVHAYKAAETIISSDNPGTNVYTFATGVLPLQNGWEATIPDSVLPVWVRTAVAISRDAVDTINDNEWSDPVKLTGTSLNTAQVFIYKRTDSSTPPIETDKPTVSVAYNFETGVLSGANNGWSVVPPLTTEKYLWIRAAVASSTELTDNIAPTEWSEARLLAANGSDGTGSGGEAYPGAERKGATYPNFNWNTTGTDNANTRWGALAGRSPVPGDVFIQVNSATGATEARAYNGTAWAVPEAVYESLVTFGVLSGDQILAGSVINAPIIRGGSLELTGNVASTHFTILRNDPFGPNNLIEWFGPKIPGVNWNTALNAPIYSGMTKGNAVTYKGADGSWYTSGSILAGTLRTANQTTALSNNTNVTTGTFGSDGGLLTIKCSFSASKSTGLVSGSCPASPVANPPTGTLYLDKWDGSNWIQVSTQSMSGNYECSDEGPEHVEQWYLSGSFTHTDSEQSTANRQFRLRVTHNTPILGGNATQRLSIITEE